MKLLTILKLCTAFAFLVLSHSYAQQRVYSSLLKKCPAGSKNVRPNSAELLALLQSEQLEYVFDYRHVAIQRGLKYLRLPAEINLGSPNFANFYKKAKVRLVDGAIKTGEVINFALTIPHNAPNPKVSIEFIKLILGSDGKKVLENHGLPSISPALTNNIRVIPDDLKGFFYTKNFNPKLSHFTIKEKTKLCIVHAESLTPSFMVFEQIFEKKFPNVDVVNEPNGGRAGVRQLARMTRSVDLVAVADYTVIKNFMFPKLANWYAVFSNDEIAIVYDENSKSTNAITEKNWHTLLVRNDIHFGRIDPNQKPSGYQTLLLWKLADLYYANRHRPIPLSSKENTDNPPKAKAVLQVFVDEKLHANLTRLELDKYSSEFSVKGHPVHRGSLLTDFFDKLGIGVTSGDQILVRGRGKASYSYTDLVNDEIGFVLTRMGTAKVVSRKKGRSSFIPHVRIIELRKGINTDD